MRPSAIGLLAGLVLGLSLVLQGFAAMLVVALCGLIGWVVAKVGHGELDLTEYLSGSRFRRSR
jgi:hypothetical protein